MGTVSNNETANEYTDALARALAYTDDIGLSDGTDRPAETVEALDLVPA